MSELDTAVLTEAPRQTVIYFVDDSATMREVVKAAFRREHIQVVAFADASSALEKFDSEAPDAVITDVIMPDKDGFQVCEAIKKHERLGATPVILMSGIVDRTVADRAMAVKADELVRKPFQPQELIGRVKRILKLDAPAPASPVSAPARTLSSLFTPAPAAASETAIATLPQIEAPSAASFFAAPKPAATRPAQLSNMGGEAQKIRNENARLELLVRRLQAELAASHEYCAALEAHIKKLQDGE
jgi:DNA-binding response OmpR family regulator